MVYYPNRQEKYRIMRATRRNGQREYDVSALVDIAWANLKAGDVVPVPAPKKGWLDGAKGKQLATFTKYTVVKKGFNVFANFERNGQKVKYTNNAIEAPIHRLWEEGMCFGYQAMPFNMHYRHNVGDLFKVVVRDPVVHWDAVERMYYAQDFDE